MGFKVTLVTHDMLNRGFLLSKHNFDGLILNGTKDFWDSSFKDM